MLVWSCYLGGMTNALYPKPFDEDYRLQVLEDLALLDTDPAPEYDRLVWLAKRHFGTKFALISLVDKDRQWFKACAGLDVTETPREVAFCTHAIMKREIFVVLDATGDPRFKENPVVVGPPHVRFYAGKPLVINGAAIGTLCIIDDKPRQVFDEEDRESLDAFAQIAIAEIEIRDNTRQAADSVVKQYHGALRLFQAGENAKAQFLATMSHELRTPLNAVIGFADCISGELLGPVEPPKYKEFAKRIADGGRRQLSLIDRLLELTDAGSVEVFEEVIDLRALASRCIDSLSGETLVAGVGMDVRLPDAAVLLKGDPVHVTQILLELISNAIKFTPQGGRICVEVSVDSDNCAVIAVDDTGIGIDEAALNEALAVFGRLNTKGDRVYQGAGLGLPIINKLAELHGAALSLSAPGTGGTRASIRFPRYRTVEENTQITMAG